MNSNLIWVPSIQNYLRFSELKTKHQKEISKISEDIEFVYYINNLIKQLCVDEFNLDEITLIDKYIICLYLRLHCIGETLDLSVNCPKCDFNFSHKINLNKFIDKSALIFDRNYQQEITVGSYTILCDIPILKNEYELLKNIHFKKIEKESIDNTLIYSTLSHIKEIKIKNKSIKFNEFSIDESIKIFESLPSNIFLAIHKTFIKPIVDSINPNILNIKCENTKECGDIKLNLNLYNINDITKLILQDSPINILREIYYLSKNSNMDSFYIEETTPLERELLIKTMTNDIKAENEESSDDSSKINYDNMEQHGFDMPESPSEFSNLQ